MTLQNASISSIEMWAELRSCVKVEVDVLGSPSLIIRTLSEDVKQN